MLVAQRGERAREVDRRRAQVVDARRAAVQRRVGGGDDDDARVGVGEQRQVARQVQPAADDDRERVGGQARGDALLAAVRIAHEPPVALGAQRARRRP